MLFAETPSRAVISVPAERRDEVLALLDDHGVPGRVLGTVGGDRLDFGVFEVPLEEATGGFEGSLAESLATSAG